MRTTVAGFVFGSLLALVIFAFAGRTEVAHGQRELPPYDNGIEVFHASDGRQLTLVDKRQEAMAVYSVDPKTNEITLRSVRNFRWDLKMDVFNGTDPQPEQIRRLLESR